MKILDIAFKDITRSFRSAFAVGMMVIAPLMLTGLIYFAFGSRSGGDVSTISIKAGVVNADQLPTDSSGGVTPPLLDAPIGVNKQKIGMAVIIKKNFTERYLSGAKDSPVLIISDPTLSIGPAVVEDMVTMMVDGVAGG